MPPRRRSSPSFLAAVRRTERGDGAPVAWSSSSLSSRSWSSSRTSPSTSSSSRSQHVFFLISDDPDVLELTHFAIKPRTPVPRSATRSLRATLRRISLVPLPLILQVRFLASIRQEVTTWSTMMRMFPVRSESSLATTRDPWIWASSDLCSWHLMPILHLVCTQTLYSLPHDV
ncbi:uncharacterized protein LOC124687099 isoform X1 [Lolium rigidum]|uniref:uncharacterized protein LOC124687099 isoform X1 n=1 Tax=Lolium rigidum TaxID=89674 RepID=UPI001F5C63B7|nr:uncharacterized protein LOC124687099 isoform X1 [Lolium rigidum]